MDIVSKPSYKLRDGAIAQLHVTLVSAHSLCNSLPTSLLGVLLCYVQSSHFFTISSLLANEAQGKKDTYKRVHKNDYQAKLS